MAKSKFSKMLEKINNNEETINSKEIEENNKTINSNVNIENEDDDINKEEMEACLEECGSEFLDNDEEDEDVGDTEDNFNNDEDDSILNDNELNEDADVDSFEDNKKEDNSEDKSENELESESENKLENELKNKSTKPEKKIKKNSILYYMLSRSEGATLDELESKLGWKRPSIRGVMSNMQKELEFCLLTIDVSKPIFNKDDGSKAFKKETRYFIRDCEFDLNDTVISLFKIDDMFTKKDNNKDDNNL